MLLPELVLAEKIEIEGVGSSRLEARDDAIKNGIDRYLTENVLDAQGKIRKKVLDSYLDYVENFWVLRTQKYKGYYKVKVLLIVKDIIYIVGKEQVEDFKDFSKGLGDE
jgi:hypothetical protein